MRRSASPMGRRPSAFGLSHRKAAHSRGRGFPEMIRAAKKMTRMARSPGRVATSRGLPTAIAGWAAGSGLDPWLVLVAMLVLLIVLGCFLESLSMIVVVLPFFWPVLVELNGGEDVAAAAAAYGLGNEELKVWFGILALVVVELGLVTPPVGLNLFIIGSLAPNVPMRETVRGVLPFLASEGVRILLLLAFPLLTLGLPRLLGR